MIGIILKINLRPKALMHHNPTRNSRIRQAIGEMNPSTAATLINKIESKRAGGYDDPTFDLILPFARSILQSSGRKAAREATILRSFCVPFEDSLVNCNPGHIQPGRINRQSIIPVWNWVSTRLIPGKISKLTDRINQAVEAENLPQIRAVCSILYNDCADALQKALTKAQKHEKTQKRLTARLGPATGIPDAWEMYLALRNAETLGELRERLPAMTSRLEGRSLETLTALMSEYFSLAPDIHGSITASFLTRLKTPSHILHIPVKVLGSADAGRICSTPFRILGDILLFDIDCLVDDLISQLRQSAPIGDILINLEEFHDLTGGFNSEVDVLARNTWGQRLGRARTRISDVLEREIRQLPALMREHIKTHGSRANDFFHPAGQKPGKAGATPLQGEEKLVHALALMKGCKPYMDQLSINATMHKVENEIEQITDYARIIGKSSVLSKVEALTAKALDFSTPR
ncbi:MAG TPA: hypothetical protein ENJ57_09185 [Rhizobiales bacterium]|nr:hypothetical protein [Hyphomicrobiales bacterium]